MNMTTVSVSGGPYTELSGAEAFYGWLAFDGNRSLAGADRCPVPAREP